MRWQGFDGGAEVRAALAEFLDGLRQRASSWNARPRTGTGALRWRT